MSDRGAERVTDLVRGAWVTLGVRAACRLDLFDALDEPRTADDLAARIGADPRTLTRRGAHGRSSWASIWRSR